MALIIIYHINKDNLIILTSVFLKCAIMNCHCYTVSYKDSYKGHRISSVNNHISFSKKDSLIMPSNIPENGPQEMLKRQDNKVTSHQETNIKHASNQP